VSDATPVVIIGELNVDLIMTGCLALADARREVNVEGFTMTLGSSSAICAVGLARLGRPVSFVGLVGADRGRLLRHRASSRRHRCLGRDARSRRATGVTVSLTSPAGRGLVT